MVSLVLLEELRKPLEDFQKRIKIIISVYEPVRSIKDIIRVFGDDLTTPFKTVFKWDV